MKYINLFEHTTDGYESINWHQYINATEDLIDFPNKELALLNSMFEIRSGCVVVLPYKLKGFSYMQLKLVRRSPLKKYNYDRINIHAMNDEWFYIHSVKDVTGGTKDSFFKCDQWDSVIVCLIKEFKFIESSRWDIKQFEELKHDHYELYGYDEISDFNITSVDFTPFSEKELHKLSEINFTVRSKDDSSWLGKSVSYRGDTGSLIIMIFNKGDEWYYVRVRDGRTSRVRCYKCDQWDGLIGCLRNQGGLDV